MLGYLAPRLREHFRREFLNRIDETIITHGLDNIELRQIPKLLLDRQPQPGQQVHVDTGGDRLALSVTGTPSPARKEERAAVRAVLPASASSDGGNANSARAQKSGARWRDQSSRGNGCARPDNGSAAPVGNGGE